ncbi:hypothetical protein FOZ60_003639 [Perkinsus olseni]|uniref:Uncharacterized protein n=1 Tax=Perkinsus olseni TaxID=32597 RepID=A0A7J6NX27_PEROL|nr:hypothetical protein FOZ60_003639 [Perkinsus olseni]
MAEIGCGRETGGYISLQLRIPYDEEFGKNFPEVAQRQHDQAEARLMELRTKWKKEKEMQQSADTLKLTNNAVNRVKERIGKAVASVTEIRKLLQTLYPQDIVTDANAVEAMKQAGGMKIRDKWILTSTGHKEIDTYRSVLLAIYRMKDSATKKEITDEFERVSGKKCTLTDHAIRRLIKEFADLKSGRWVFRGETLEELREQAGVGGEGGAAAAAVELWDVSGDDGEFDSCYRAVQNGCEGVILVYDPNQREQTPRFDSDDDHMKSLQAVPASMERIGSITTIGHVAELEAEQIRNNAKGLDDKKCSGLFLDVFCDTKPVEICNADWVIMMRVGEGSAEGSVNAALPLRTFTTSHSSFPPPVAPHNTVASMCDDEPFDSAPLDPAGKWAAHTTATERVNGDSLHESAVHVSDRRALPRSAPACRMVRVKLVKAIPDDKFGFVNQPPSCGEMGTGDPTCLEIVTIVNGQLLDKWNKRQTEGTRVTEGSYITAVNGAKFNVKKMREELKSETVDMEVHVPIHTT